MIHYLHRADQGHSAATDKWRMDSDMTRPSYAENGDGYILTTALMRWFWDHNADPAAA